MNNSLKDVLYKVPIIAIAGPSNQKITNINTDSRKVKENNLFIALKGFESDGHEYIQESIDNGANSVVCLKFPKTLKD